MRGAVVGGVYKAAIGKRAMLHGEQIGREMGMSTWVNFGGTNDRALAHGEFVAAVRYVLDVEVGATSIPGKRI